MTNKLTQPTQIDDLLLYRLRRLVATGGATVIRMCEGQLGITWREWRVMASLRPGVSLLSSELAVHAQLDRARTSRAITSLVSKKLVLRQLVPHDQRKATVTLTDKGREVKCTACQLCYTFNSKLGNKYAGYSLVFHIYC